MKIEIFDTSSELSNKAKDIVIDEIEKNKNLLLCTATGGSPTASYNQLGKAFLFQPELFSKLRIVKLDEWGGIPMNHQGSCETYLQKYLIQPLKISNSRYFSFNSNPLNSVEECGKMQNLLSEEGPIDLCILGLGMNGHIAFNEPAEYLQPFCHIAELSELSLSHSMATGMSKDSLYGLTLGMANILHSKKIILIISGAQKKEIVKQFLSKRITSKMPASFLWLHPNVTCLIEDEAIGEDEKNRLSKLR